MTDSIVQLVVELTHSPTGWFGWKRGAPERGGFTATLVGFPGVGQDTTVAGALDDLANELREWIEALDADADDYPHRDPSEFNTDLSTSVRRMLRAGTLRSELEAAAGEPVLDSG